jgi:hypothetical protein
VTTPPPEPPEEGPAGAPDAGRDDLPDGFDFDAEFAKAFGDDAAPALGPDDARSDADPGRDDAEASSASAGPATSPRSLVALVLTPIASAPAVAGVCAMAGLDAVHVVPTRRGAVVARVIERGPDAEMEELLGGAPAAAEEMATALSRTTRYGAVLLISRLGEGDEGLVGSIAASSWVGGARSDEKVSAGLMLAQADDVVEQLLLGVVAPADAPGAIVPGHLRPWQARRLFRKGRGTGQKP